MSIVAVEVDLAKSAFALHDAVAAGKLALVRLAGDGGNFLELIASLTPCLMGIESFGVRRVRNISRESFVMSA